ncbi:30S ribosomal protein S16 [Candidatus Microgenomates bacterium]|nr:30S ribosomal protein S16 [Candidatus Microgenomates bacterium]
MAVALKLMRFGKKGHPTYRIVAIDKRKPRTSEYLENIGIYQPVGTKTALSIKKSRLEYWQSQGAQISEGLTKLLKNKKKITFTE